MEVEVTEDYKLIKVTFESLPGTVLFVPYGKLYTDLPAMFALMVMDYDNFMKNLKEGFTGKKS